MEGSTVVRYLDSARRCLRRVADPFTLGLGPFVRRLPAVIPVVVYVAIAGFEVGAGLNVPALVWGGGVVAGLSTALLFAYLWVLTFVLDASFDPDRGPAPEEGETGSAVGPLGAYLLPSLGLSVAALAVFTVVRVDGSPPYLHLYPDAPYAEAVRPLVAERGGYLAGLLLGTGLVVAALAFAYSRGRRTLAPWSAADRRRAVRRTAVGLFAAQAVLYGGCLVAVEAGIWYPPPVLAVNTVFGLVAGVAGGVWYWCRGWAVLAFVLLGVWLNFATQDPYKLRFPHMEPEYQAIGTDQAVRLGDFEAAGADWNAIDQDERAAEWGRVARLTARRAAQVGGPAGDALRERVARLVAGPPSAAAYGELVGTLAAALAARDREETAVLDRWKAAAPKRPGADRPKLVVVTVTGGANRSALWSAVVLTRLGEEIPDFHRHVRLVAGASGGMVGAGYYVGSLTDKGLPADFDPADVAQDHLVPVLDSVAFRELPFLFLPFPYTRDRGHALDLSLEGEGSHLSRDVAARLRRAFGQTFSDLAPGEEAGWRPPLVYSPMTVEDGRRLVISNRHLHPLTVSAGNLLTQEAGQAGDRPPPSGPDGRPGVAVGQRRGRKQVGPTETVLLPTMMTKKTAGGQEEVVPQLVPVVRPRADTLDVYARSGVEFFHLFPAARDRFRLSTAARMNATFPVVSPAVDLPTDPPRRVVDAGYYDNYGVGLAAAWLYHHREWLTRNTAGVVVVQVRDSASHHDRRHLRRAAEIGDEGPAGGSPLAWLTGPLAAADKARQTSTSFRNDEQLATLDAYFKQAVEGDKRFFQTVVFERYTEVGMSWYLSDRDRAEIARSWADEQLPGGLRNYNPGAVRALKEWWAGR
ncbi:MAG: hypothetical protein U0871_01110 [Gemmataceae bacterium]